MSDERPPLTITAQPRNDGRVSVNVCGETYVVSPYEASKFARELKSAADLAYVMALTAVLEKQVKT